MMGAPPPQQLKPSQLTGSQPSQFQLALALAIAKSKPEGIGVRVYLAKIRQHILDGTRAANYGSVNEYLDAAAYWHDMFKESQKEIHELQTQMTRLERDNERLKTSSPVGVVATLLPQEGSTSIQDATVRSTATVPPGFKDVTAPKKRMKRKQDETKGAASNRPTKKVAGKIEKPVSALANEILIDELGIIDVAGAGSTTVLHLYRAHRLYQRLDPDLEDLAYHLTRAAASLVDHVSAVAKQIQQHILDASAVQDKRLRDQFVTTATSKTDSELSCILRAAGRSFMSLFHGLTTMWEKATEAAKRHHGAVTYHYTEAFGALLDAISSNCVLVAQLHAQQIANEAPSSSVAAKKTHQKKAQKSRPAGKTRITQELVSLLVALLTHLTPARQGSHTALFEGILYLLLERTGKRLYLLTFNRERGATLDDEIIDSPPSPATQLGSTERHAINIEVKYLVQLLESALSLAPSFLGSTSGADVPVKGGRGAASSKRKFTSLPNRPGALSILAKNELQRTLVECMFGSPQLDKNDHSAKTIGMGGGDGLGQDNETEDEDAVERNNEFIEELRKPVFVGSVPHVPKVDEMDVPEWFTESIWRLVGWDVLGWDREF